MDSLWRLQVTVERLEGLLWIGKRAASDVPLDLSALSASITFQGSISAMQVNSCRICQHSAQCMIESEGGLQWDSAQTDGLSWVQATFATSTSTCSALFLFVFLFVCVFFRLLKFNFFFFV